MQTKHCQKLNVSSAIGLVGTRSLPKIQAVQPTNHAMADEPANRGPESGETPQFERQLSENSMEYMIFVLDDAIGGIKYLSRLESISKAATRLLESVAKNYIWQRDEFHLSVVNEQGERNITGWLGEKSCL